MKLGITNRAKASLLSILAIATLGQELAEAAPHNRPFPGLRLGRRANGGEAASALGAKLGEVARWYGKDEWKLRQQFQRDKGLNVDSTGRLFYSCAGPLPGDLPPDQSAVTTSAPYPTSQSFLLHSCPGAPLVIYLDFNGHTTSGTQWNTEFTNEASIVTPAFSQDANTAAFTTAELQAIQVIWQRVADDYSAWHVDVTTQDPGLEALRKSSPEDTNYGIRVAIGGKYNDWYATPAAGVAYVTSFAWESDTPAFVFSDTLGFGDPKKCGENISHEVGHTLGLSHKGTSAAEYFSGAGEWAPIMGSSYTKAVTHWSRGEYPDANNTEDEVAIIASYVPQREDLAGDGTINAFILPAVANPSTTGVIETANDADLYLFDTAAGTISFTATPAVPEGNVNLSLSLYDAAGNFITSNDPIGLAGNLSVNVAAGTYVIAVDGVGTGDPLSGAYSDYGSLGQFYLTGSVIPIVNTPPVALASSNVTSGQAPLNVQFTGSNSSDPDGSIVSYDWDFGDGTTSTAANPQHTYTTVGTFIASLVVTDNGGLSSAATVTITTQASTVMRVSSLAPSLITSVSKGKATYQGRVIVTIRTLTGAPVANARVYASWTGLTSASVNARTNSSGQVTFLSTTTQSRGAFNFSVTNVTATGFSYNASQNVQTSVSIATP